MNYRFFNVLNIFNKSIFYTAVSIKIMFLSLLSPEIVVTDMFEDILHKQGNSIISFLKSYRYMLIRYICDSDFLIEFWSQIEFNAVLRKNNIYSTFLYLYAVEKEISELSNKYVFYNHRDRIINLSRYYIQMYPKSLNCLRVLMIKHNTLFDWNEVLNTEDSYFILYDTKDIFNNLHVDLPYPNIIKKQFLNRCKEDHKFLSFVLKLNRKLYFIYNIKGLKDVIELTFENTIKKVKETHNKKCQICFETCVKRIKLCRYKDHNYCLKCFETYGSPRCPLCFKKLSHEDATIFI